MTLVFNNWAEIEKAAENWLKERLPIERVSRTEFRIDAPALRDLEAAARIAAAKGLLAACIEAEKNYAPYDGPLLGQLREAIDQAGGKV